MVLLAVRNRQRVPDVRLWRHRGVLGRAHSCSAAATARSRCALWRAAQSAAPSRPGAYHPLRMQAHLNRPNCRPMTSRAAPHLLRTGTRGPHARARCMLRGGSPRLGGQRRPNAGNGRRALKADWGHNSGNQKFGAARARPSDPPNAFGATFDRAPSPRGRPADVRRTPYLSCACAIDRSIDRSSCKHHTNHPRRRSVRPDGCRGGDVCLIDLDADRDRGWNAPFLPGSRPRAGGCARSRREPWLPGCALGLAGDTSLGLIRAD